MDLIILNYFDGGVMLELFLNWENGFLVVLGCFGMEFVDLRFWFVVDICWFDLKNIDVIGDC